MIFTLKNKTTESKTLYINSTEKTALFHFTNALNKIKEDIGKRTIIILCIGTDRATGDSLGPLIGYKLSKINTNNNTKIFGTLENPVHAQNLTNVITNIYNCYANPFVIAIDACLGRIDHINHITLSRTRLKPGAGVNKALPEIGDISITGIVNSNSYMGITTLQSTRLYTVMNMADIITNGITLSLLK